MTEALELLAPARTAQIGIAAIDCGADAVYIAGPAFGARQAAGNPVEDIARLCSYAHRFGAKIYATVNTLVYENELEEVRSLVKDLEKAGVDALIVQDPAVLELAKDTSLVMHASTQCTLLTPEKACLTESLGYGRLVLERQLSLDQIKAIRAATTAELEFFVHGALCVCYSGQCYLSEHLTGRSANRGACAQPCRSLYNLEDAAGKVLVRNKALLSLKDYNLLHRLGELADAGIVSFKIEGRLKGESYVRNVVKAYSEALDALVALHPERYRRTSFGKVKGGFTPNLDKTFNRGYTELFLDGRRGQWASMDAPKSMGEYIGTVKSLTRDGLVIAPEHPSLKLSNGDGLAFVGKDGSIVGFRADVCDGLHVRCKRVEGLKEGGRLYRNISAAFEKELAANRPERLLAADIRFCLKNGRAIATATTEDGRTAQVETTVGFDAAREQEKMLETVKVQLQKTSGHYAFSVSAVEMEGLLPFMPASFLNGIRRSLAEELDRLPVNALPLKRGVKTSSADESSHQGGTELMRSKYCIRHELGLCPKQGKAPKAEPLYLLNAGRRLRLDFHCKECEMTVTDS